MKRFLTCFCAIVCIAPSVFAADAAFSRVVPTSNNSQSVSNTGRVTTSRVATRTNAVDTEQAVSNSVRSTVSRVFSGEAEIASPTRASVVSRVSSESAARSNLQATINTVGRNARVSSASINSNPAVRRAGLVLRPSTAEVGGRAIIDESGLQTGSNINDEIRTVSSRAAKEVTAESIAQATEKLEQTATLNKSCQDQYNECMDQFCAVVDANQKRCSCSANLSRYTKVEQAVKDANNQLNEVAQRIRYVGLSADEIRAIMTQTEAEAELSGTSDTSETRSMLAEIEALIKDPVSATSSYASSVSMGLDMDLDFSSNTADIFSLDFLDTNTSSSFSNLRGSELYNAAKSRCNTVLKQCKSAGATTSQVTGNYDLAIDKDCIAYEQGLTKMNETLVSNVRSANLMLQKARLAVLQNKNQYDAKGCVGALETCMKDDMVCGDNYYKCIDPSKNYIDENGEVILGQNIASVTDSMSQYDNSNITKDFLEASWNGDFSSVDGLTDDQKSSDSNGGNIVKYLLSKIGTGSNITDGGLCRAVLDKCQNYTYNDGIYNPYNYVVENYVQRAMVNVRAAQHKIISEYASSCALDIAECYRQQYSQVSSWASNASVASVQSVMRGACRNVALTCAYAVFAKDMPESCNTNSNEDECKLELIDGISNMFYQSLLCPDNSVYDSTCGETSSQGCVNAACRCAAGYEVYGATCRISCGDNRYYDTISSTCKCIDGYEMKEGLCCAPGTRLLGGGKCWTEQMACGADPNHKDCTPGDYSCKSGYKWSPLAAQCISEELCNGDNKDTCIAPRIVTADGKTVGVCSWRTGAWDSTNCVVSTGSEFAVQ